MDRMVKNTSSSENQIPTMAIAIGKDKSSQYAVKWAVDNIILNKKQPPCCVLIHVRNLALNSLDAQPMPKGGRPPTELEMHQLLLPFRGYCARKGVQVTEVVLHDIEVSSAIIDYIESNNIANIALGASTRNAFTRLDVPSTVAKEAPDTCTVYVIHKGKVQSCRSASQPSTRPPEQPSQIRLSPKFPPESPVSVDTFRSNSISESRRSLNSDMRSVSSDSSSNTIPTTPLSTFLNRKSPSPLRRSMEHINLSKYIPSWNFSRADSSSSGSDYSGRYSFISNDMSSSDSLECSYSSGSSMGSFSPTTTLSHDIDAEMKKLRLGLKQNIEIYKAACNEDHAADQKGRELKPYEDAALLVMTTVKKNRSKASQIAQHLTQLEIQEIKNTEMKLKDEVEERKRVMDTLSPSNIRYRRYNFEDIKSVTDNFSDSRKIGEGGYGPVYQAVLDHTAVAIKVMRPDFSQGQTQFQQEVEVLSGMRHPNMVLLLGACPEDGCLVYEYMEYGSLEDRLFKKDSTPPIPWQTRFKIAAEIATTLLFLHQTKPEPLVHRDLKPGNILLNSNYVSKISDVGISRLVPASSPIDKTTQYHMTSAAGTFCYIDPEYQQTGKLCVKSDVYSLGVMLLQIITAKPPMGLTHQVESAIESGDFVQVLDQDVTDWPVNETLSFAKLALKCCELRKKDRPDLCTIVVPQLNLLRRLSIDGFREGVSYVPDVEM